MQAIVTRELTVRGTYGFDEKDFAAAIQAMATGRMSVEPLIEKVAGLDEGPELFRQLAKGESDLVKVVLQP